jgi:hypothetical protein
MSDLSSDLKASAHLAKATAFCMDRILSPGRLVLPQPVNAADLLAFLEGLNAEIGWGDKWGAAGSGLLLRKPEGWSLQLGTGHGYTEPRIFATLREALDEARKA